MSGTFPIAGEGCDPVFDTAVEVRGVVVLVFGGVEAVGPVKVDGQCL